MIVPWYQVRDYMHVDTGWREGVTSEDGMFRQSGASRSGAVNAESERRYVADGGAGSSVEIEKNVLSSDDEAIEGTDDGASAEGDETSLEIGAEEAVDIPKNETVAIGSSGEGSAHLQNDATAYYANAGYGAAGMRAGSAAKPAEDTRSFKEREKDIFAAEDELRSIFERTYGPIKSTVGQNANTGPRRVTGTEAPKKYRKPKPKPEKEYLLVDGYNIIFAWDELRNLAQGDVKAARDSLMDRLSNYAGFTKKNVICVFDAYKVPGGTEQIYRYHNIDVIFTREAETADQYIEKAAHELTKQYQVTVATSDAIEQIIIYGAGAVRLSARNFESEVVNAEREMQAQYIAQDTDRRQTVGSSVGEEIRKAMARENG